MTPTPIRTTLYAGMLVAALTCTAISGTSDREPVTLQSADGTKSIRGWIEKVERLRGDVLLDFRMADTGKRSRFSYNRLAEADKERIAAIARAADAVRAFGINVRQVDETAEPRLVSGRRLVETEAKFALEFRNNGKQASEPLDVEYKVFFQKAGYTESRSSTKFLETRKGSDQIGTLAPRAETVLETASVDLISNRPNVGGPG